jgi:hypothetical protein
MPAFQAQGVNSSILVMGRSPFNPPGATRGEGSVLELEGLSDKASSIAVVKPHSRASPTGSSAQQAATISDSQHLAARQREETLAKGQLKGNKEAKKPKADKSQPKATISAYKQSQSKGGQATTPFAKKS